MDTGGRTGVALILLVSASLVHQRDDEEYAGNQEDEAGGKV